MRPPAVGVFRQTRRSGGTDRRENFREASEKTFRRLQIGLRSKASANPRAYSEMSSHNFNRQSEKIIIILIISELTLHLDVVPQYRATCCDKCSRANVNACVKSRNKFRLGDDILSFASARPRVHQKITAETAGELFSQIPDPAILALRFDAVRCPHLLGGTQDSSIAFDVDSDDTCEHFVEIRVGINYCELKIIFFIIACRAIRRGRGLE